MSLMWSGPGKALNAHLELFEKIQRCAVWADAVAAAGKRVDLEQVPPLMLQRMLLCSSMGHVQKVVGSRDGISIDGYSPALDRDDPNFEHPEESVDRAGSLLRSEYHLLNRGETHYVSHNVTKMVEMAAAQASDEPLFPTDLPCPAGLIVLEYPLIMNDLHPDTGKIVQGLDMPTRAIGWRYHPVFVANADGSFEQRDGIMYVCYTDEESYQAVHIPAVKRLLVDEGARGEDYVDRAVWGGQMLGMWATDFSGWAYGMGWHRAGDGSKREDFAKGEIHDNVASIRRFLLAYFRFTWQRIIVPQPYQPSRPERRRADRIRRMPEEGYVKILRLRRHVEMEARGEKVDEAAWAYDHAWICRGHPRRQHYATLGPARNPDGSFNVDSHRLIWIDPYLKGNPEGPLIRGHNVTAAVR